MLDAIYIGRDGQQLGPYSKVQLAAMAAAGQILPGDMAWHQGMQGWEAAAAVLARLGIVNDAQTPLLQPAAIVIPARGIAGAATEASSGASAPAAADRNLAAGLGTRWLASFIDGLLLGVCLMMVGFFWGIASVFSRGHTGSFLWFALLAQLAYFTLTQGGAGMATLGKRAMGMIVVGRDGRAIGYPLAALRYVLLLISSYLFPLLLVVFFTRRRQGLHDLVLGTVVLDRDSYDPAHFDYEHIQKSPRGGGALLVLAIAAVVFVFFGGILAAIAIPAYQDYTMRAKIQGAITRSDPIKAAVTQHYSSSNEPVQYADIGMSGPLALPGDQGLITVNSSGVITIMLGMKPLIGQSIRLTPTLSTDGIRWNCVSDDVRKAYLPLSCR